MKIIQSHDSHQDERRMLIAWEEDIRASEIKHMFVNEEGVRLGGHKHPFQEKFLIASGSVIVETWTEESGKREHALRAPQVAIFEPNEEHAITCSAGTIIIVFLQKKFSQQNIIKAQNL